MVSRTDIDTETAAAPATSPADAGAPRAPGALWVGELAEDWSGDARYFEYTSAADPIAAGSISAIPIETFAPSLHQLSGTGIVPLDLSGVLGIDDGPATSPGLLASFIRIQAGEQVSTSPTATSELYYAMAGSGSTRVDGHEIRWSEGDFLTLPGGRRSTHHGTTDTTMYWVTDEPLLRYLGVTPAADRFSTTLYPAARVRSELDAIAHAPDAATRSRVSVLLANAAQPQTLTATHVLWAMFGVVPPGAVQRPHRHQSVAVDLCVGAQEGCYTLLGQRLDGRGDIIDPIRVDWVAGGAFTTPPGMWHSHHNESGANAWVIPIQDAGLQTYLRSLDIRFAPAAT